MSRVDLRSSIQRVKQYFRHSSSCEKIAFKCILPYPIRQSNLVSNNTRTHSITKATNNTITVKTKRISNEALGTQDLEHSTNDIKYKFSR